VLETFINEAKYDIRGTVRSLANSKRLDPLRKHLGEGTFSKIELVEADLMNEESLNKAVKGCTYVIHVASPLTHDRSVDEKLIVEPAVNGTKFVLNACKEHKVKRLVITSSMLTIIPMM
jgi:nucleoside-diphosphate-sugar epimerase